MNQRDDLGTKTPGDWLAVVRQGEAWGFPSCYGQDTAKCSSTPSPVAELDEHAAVSGVAIVTGQLGSTLGTGAAVAESGDGQGAVGAAHRIRTNGGHRVPQRLREPGARHARQHWRTVRG